MTKTFVPLVEHNDHEGETWTQWLQVEGNEDQLEYLYTALFRLDEAEDSYQLDLDDRESEEVVDRMVARARCGYTWSDSKVTGRLSLPNITTLEELNDVLYKGNIEDYFKE